MSLRIENNFTPDEATITYDNVRSSFLVRNVIQQHLAALPAYQEILGRLHARVQVPGIGNNGIALVSFVAGLLFFIIGLFHKSPSLAGPSLLMVFFGFVLALRENEVSALRSQVINDANNGYLELRALYREAGRQYFERNIRL